MQKKIDIFCAGELLADLISVEFTDRMDQVETFKRVMGGSPANLCMNMARLGHSTKLAATVGNDDLGTYLIEVVKQAGVDVKLVRKSPVNTTIILVTRSKAAANFEAYRGADIRLTASQFPLDVLRNTKIFHTTSFALSLQPARANILAAANTVFELGGQLSIDANYAQKIWPNNEDGRLILESYCAMGSLVKVSEVDWERLYHEPLNSPQKAAEYFLKLGAREVCVTLGADGSYAANDKESHFMSAKKIEVVDTTGAGDAFWSGYLSAWLHGKSLQGRLESGSQVAGIKLGILGPIRHAISING